jgi:hypothetical protein
LEGFTDSLQGKHRTALEYFELALQRAKRFTRQHPESEWGLEGLSLDEATALLEALG